MTLGGFKAAERPPGLVPELGRHGRDLMTPPVINGLSFDVEEWFHVLDVPSAPQPRQWDAMPRTVERNTRRLLEILDDANVRATFFVLGWVADRYPRLVRDIAEAGHEVASHGDRHRLVYQQGRGGLEQDLRRARGLLEDLIGQPVIGYRAPGFSIGPRAPWAFDVIRKAGFLYDSSCSRRDASVRRMRRACCIASRSRTAVSGRVSVQRAEFGSFRLPFSEAAMWTAAVSLHRGLCDDRMHTTFPLRLHASARDRSRAPAPLLLEARLPVLCESAIDRAQAATAARRLRAPPSTCSPSAKCSICLARGGGVAPAERYRGAMTERPAVVTGRGRRTQAPAVAARKRADRLEDCGRANDDLPGRLLSTRLRSPGRLLGDRTFLSILRRTDRTRRGSRSRSISTARHGLRSNARMPQPTALHGGMRMLLEIAFWIAATWIGYALVLYPGITIVLGTALARVRAPLRGDLTPRIPFIVAAYNEERVIERKVRQTLSLDYPADQIEVIVASDGSTDRTDEIVRSIADPRVRLFRAEGRVGKTATVNGAVEVSTGELLVFSDATGVFSHGALRALAARFADREVGCAAGRVAYQYGGDTTSRLRIQRSPPVRRAETRSGARRP